MTLQQQVQKKSASQAAPEVAQPAKGPSLQFKLDVASRPVGEQVQMLRPSAPLPVVQQKADPETETEQVDVHAEAQRGLSGSASGLPHGDKIQQAFGHHDVSDVRAHVGGPAAEASAAMGAEAYATGNSVAFANNPSLHTAAHEAAHIVQQSQGVSLTGGVGQAGDQYERHADAVADKVVAGESAESLLDESTGSGGGNAAVQKRDGNSIEQLREALDGWGADSGEIKRILRRASASEKRQILGDSDIMGKLRSKLNRGDQLECLNLLNAPLTQKLYTAMDGWGADSNTIKRLVRDASAEEKASVLSNTRLVNRLKSELSRDDMLSVLASLDAPLALRLNTAMDGWGADVATIRRLTADATDEQKAALLTDTRLMNRLASELSREDMLGLLADINAPLEMQINTAMDGWGCDAATIRRLLEGATDEQKQAVLANSAMMQRLGSELSREDMLAVLRIINAPLNMRLNAAMDGWGCDAETIRTLTASATEDEKAAVLADATLVQRLASELSRDDMLTVLANVDAPLTLQLNTAMDGWGCDAETIKTLTAGATDDQKREVLENDALVQRLASELSREDMLTVLENIDAPLELKLNTAMDGWGADGEAIKRLINAATDAEKDAVGQNEELFNRLVSELSTPDKNEVCDVLFPKVTDLDSLKRIFTARFNVKLGTCGDADAVAWLGTRTEQPILENAVRRVYNLFKTLPKAHVDLLTHVIATDNSSGGAASGAASQSYFRLGYDETMTGDVESGAYTDDPSDLTRGLNILDTTTAHELAHIIDGGRRYSSTEEFRAFSGWTRHGFDHTTLVSEMEGDMTSPLPAGLTNQEKTAARKAAKLAAENRRDDTADMDDDVDQAYDDASMNRAGDGTDYRSAADLFTALETCNLFEHIALGHVSNGIWRTEPYSAYLPTKQYHEAYDWDGWYSYNNSARATKFSWYQFRTYGEEFAELYATYHLTDPKGSTVPAAMKTWFEAQGLHTGTGAGAGGGGSADRHNHDHDHDH